MKADSMQWVNLCRLSRVDCTIQKPLLPLLWNLQNLNYKNETKSNVLVFIL